MAAPQRDIVIKYSISVPPRASLPDTLPASSSTVTVPVPDAASLPTKLEEARAAMNGILSEWKNAIGELEKEKEARVVKMAAEDKKKEREAKGLESDDEDEEEEE